MSKSSLVGPCAAPCWLALAGAAPAGAQDPAAPLMQLLNEASQAAAPVMEQVTPLCGVPGNMNAPDLNGDGRPDLAVPLFGSDVLSVRINDGRGRFGPLRRYKVGIKPSFITRGDLDRDGDVDLAISNAATADVSVLLGNGDGTLQPARAYPISAGGSHGLGGHSNGTFSLEAADVTGDGILDIVTNNSVSNDLSVLPGRGDGTFGAASVFPIAGPSSVGIIPFALSVGDLDGDGDLDALNGGVSSVTVMLNDGHGAFTATSSNVVGLDIACTKLGDLDEDGITDAFATGTGTMNVLILIGRGDGSFASERSIFSRGFGPQCGSIEDFDRDGHLDLAIVNSSSHHARGVVAVLRGRGEGRLGGSMVRTTYPTRFAPWATDTADFDHDGKVDLAVANSFPPSVTVLLGRGTGRFTRSTSYGM
jgi:hypothetical protein